ncbi:hypothetical protein PENSUB_6351 [Penicillium subrubescens]|jgi:hypothetical protein|uniref:RNA polymerase Rpb5 N-terminal domain-containing protein n=1 Tax=Penicillium subrubescens TaxID=1316194 RepID=A0A1Q5U1P7_9EURO|nr:hypothetical protein PENSUB_6351 [Penicillium subrubescens]
MDGDIPVTSTDASREMSRLWRTWKTVHEMLADRVSSQSPLTETLAIAQGSSLLQKLGFETDHVCARK